MKYKYEGKDEMNHNSWRIQDQNDKWSSKCRTPIERINSAGEIWNSVFYLNKPDECEVVAADGVWGVFCLILY